MTEEILGKLKNLTNVKSAGPSKALVMSFHGWTGGGKNYVAQFVADSLYDLDQQKKYVHLFTSEIHFPDRKKVDLYRDNIKVTIFNYFKFLNDQFNESVVHHKWRHK